MYASPSTESGQFDQSNAALGSSSQQNKSKIEPKHWAEASNCKRSEPYETIAPVDVQQPSPPQMKQRLRQLFGAAIDELRIDHVMRSAIECNGEILEIGDESINLDDFKKVIVVSVGKAAGRMAEEFTSICAPKKVSGVVVSSVETTVAPRYFMRYIGGHPYPNRESFHAASVVEELVKDLNEQHLVIYLLSGGGSAIFERPIDDSISFEDSHQFFQLLVTCGADIVEINTLRKHFSAVKGGRLAIQAHPARQLTLYISDVPEGHDSSVASGPTMSDPTTIADCYRIVEKYGLLDKLPQSIRKMFDEQSIAETPGPEDGRFSTGSYHCLLSNAAAVAVIERSAQEAGWQVEVDLSVDDLPLAEAADILLARLDRLRASDPSRPAAVITGGELSSPVHGDGQGGRNQAFVLDCVQKIAGRNIAVISAGTDGIDGNSPAAGAVADGDTLKRAEQAGLSVEDYTRRSDSYNFFKALDDALETGPTENNVRDIRLLTAW
jgi:glycerate 2-kinase